jgi:hypothetical protein
LWLWVVVPLAVVAAVLIVWVALRTPRGLGLLETLRPLLQELSGDERRIGQIILDNYIEYRADARNWSAVYFGSLFLSAACAALAGLVIKLEFVRNDAVKKDLAAALAMVSALFVTLSTVGGFHQRWLANRLAAAKIEQVAYAFITATDRKAEYFLLQIQAISYRRNEDIVADGSDSSKATDTGK